MALKKKTVKRRPMRGGMHALSPAGINDMHAGNFAASQQSAGASASGAPAPNVSLAQSGGKGKKSMKGGYFAELLSAAVVPFGLVGLNHYAHTYSGKKPYMGKSRLSKRIRSHRNKR
jgi:hypothetical protein